MIVAEDRPSAAKKIAVLTPAALAALLLAAHFLRSFDFLAVGVCVALPCLLLTHRAWAVRVVQAGLGFGALIWLYTAEQLIADRLARSEPFVRLSIILGAVAALTLSAAALLETAAAKRILRRD